MWTDRSERDRGERRERTTSAARWHVLLDGELRGPLSCDAIAQLLRTSPGAACAPIWLGRDPWVTAAEIPELAELIRRAPAAHEVPTAREPVRIEANEPSIDRGPSSGHVDLAALTAELDRIALASVASSTPAPVTPSTPPLPVAIAVPPHRAQERRWISFGRGALAGGLIVLSIAIAPAALTWLDSDVSLDSDVPLDDDAPIASAQGTSSTSAIATTSAEPAPIVVRERAAVEPSAARVEPIAARVEPIAAVEPAVIAGRDPAVAPVARVEAPAVPPPPIATPAPERRAEPIATGTGDAPSRSSSRDRRAREQVSSPAEPVAAATAPPENPFDAPEPAPVAAPAQAPAAAAPRSIDQLLEAATPAEERREPARPSGPELPDAPARADVDRALASVEAEVRACGASQRGIAPVRITVAGESGRVRSALVEGAFAGTPVGSCIARAVRGVTFPRFARETFVVQYAYRL